MEIKNPFTPAKRFFRLLKPDSKEISYIYLYAIFAGFITLSLPLGVQAIINLLTGGETSSSLWLLIGIITAGIALNGFLTIMQLTVTEAIQRRIFTRSAFEFAWRIPRLKPEALTEIYAPELINRFFDTITLQKGIPKILMDTSSAILQIIFGLILLSFYHPSFVFFGGFLSLTLFAIFRLTGQRGIETSLKESKYKYAVAHWLEELGRTMNIFKMSGAGEGLPIERTNHLTESYLTARKSHFRVLLAQYSSIIVFKVIITAALLILGTVLVINNEISIGQFVAAEIVVILITGSVDKLIKSMENIYDVLTALEKIGFVTDLPMDNTDGLSFEDLNTEAGVAIEMDEVSFQFADADVPTLKNISLSIKKGEHICISGYNGSGKSTLVSLLEGLYSNFSGMIAYNGIPIKGINPESLRKRIGVLSLQNEIFNGTILENITLGKNKVSVQDVVKVAKDIDLHLDVNHLPKGYQTVLLAGGTNVPRSVRTKIVLARTLISDPCLLLFDNFMPRIEQKEKEHIIDFLTQQNRHRTLVAISDNAEFAAKCDRVILLKKGEIVADGHFDDLKKNEYIRDIFRLPELQSAE